MSNGELKRDLDPKPFVSPRGVRYAVGDLYFGSGPLEFDPRPDYSKDRADYGV